VAKRLIIAIDGPSGAGKGTVARAVSHALGYGHVDTGAMYRAVGWKALHDGISPDDEDVVAALARRADIIVEGGIVSIDGHDVTQAIRTPEIDKAATSVARLPHVREILVARQRAIGEQGGVVMEGRDIGTVVFPGADVKVYLDASPDERARRRAMDPAHSAGGAGQAAVAASIEARDKADTTRTVSPLVLAPDATLIDTTGMPIDQVVSRVLQLVRRRRGKWLRKVRGCEGARVRQSDGAPSHLRTLAPSHPFPFSPLRDSRSLLLRPGRAPSACDRGR
jgi:cytidylate kinase